MFIFTQVEKSAKEPAGSGSFSGISWKQYSGDWIYSVPPGTYRNLSKPAARYGHRILAPDFWHFPAGSGRKE
jgi:hypothetical protein